MTQSERRLYLIQTLLDERRDGRSITIPADEDQQKMLFRGLVNVRRPWQISETWLRIQDDYLKQEIQSKGITNGEELQPLRDNLCLWRGDITTLKCDAIVNAANKALLGCFGANHICIDNCIHTFAGVQLRLACAKIMEKQGADEPTGSAKITSAFNLPSRYVLHTVGPIVYGELTELHCHQLASCYNACLDLALRHELRSVAFCCISTGEFHFPKEKAAQIAVETVTMHPAVQKGKLRVIFNVFNAGDEAIYRRILV